LIVYTAKEELLILCDLEPATFEKSGGSSGFIRLFWSILAALWLFPLSLLGNDFILDGGLAYSSNDFGRINEVAVRRARLLLHGMGDRPQTCTPPRYVTSYPHKLSLLPLTGWEMNISQSVSK